MRPNNKARTGQDYISSLEIKGRYWVLAVKPRKTDGLASLKSVGNDLTKNA